MAKSKQKSERLQKLIKVNFSKIPKNSKVFEIGSADGINAKFIESLGFKVTASDTVDGFINVAKKLNLNTIKFNVITDNFPEKYYAIFAWRVFVHFTKEDSIKVILKIYDVLENNGIFIFNTINRETTNIESEWIDFEGNYHMGESVIIIIFTKKN